MRKSTAPTPPSFAALVQQFFTEYLVAQRAVSAQTVACYRDALTLFLDFASRKLGKTHQNVLVFVKGDPRAAAEAAGPVEVADRRPPGLGEVAL